MSKILLDGRPIRILVASDAPWASSGYSNQVRTMAPHLAELCDLAIMTTYGLQGNRLEWQGLPIYPGGADPFGNDVIQHHADHWKADVVITLKDSFVFRPDAFRGLRWAPMVPVDHEPAPPGAIHVVRHAWQPIAYAPNGVRELRKAGLDPLYAPHAYDPAVMYPGDRAAARAALGLPADAFIVGTVAVNRGGVPSRKAWPQLIEGVALARRTIPNLLYLAHTYHGEDRFEGSIPLRHLAQRYGLPTLMLPDGERYKQGFTDDEIRTLYQAMDVLLCVSAGEGFGIPTLEAQACGVPVIAGAWAAQEDLIWGGWALQRHEDALAFFDAQDADMYIPFPGAIAHAVEEAHAALSDPEQRADLAALAVAGAAAHRIEKVAAEHWRPVLETMARRIEAERLPRGVLRIVRPEEVMGA
jgi:glycosyltransferase involved in cell wall biosynthesis